MASKVRSIQREMEKRKAAESTITVTLRVVVSSMNAINILIAQPMEARHAFKLARAIKAIKPEIDTYNETRQALLGKHGANLNADKTDHEFETDEAKAAFKKEFEELLDTELSLQTERVKLDMIQGASISAGAMLDLDWLIAE